MVIGFIGAGLFSGRLFLPMHLPIAFFENTYYHCKKNRNEKAILSYRSADHCYPKHLLQEKLDL